LDAVTLVLYLFFGFILLMLILIGIAFLRAIFGINKTSETYPSADTTKKLPNREEDDQVEKDSREDSEGDGLMLFDDPMFPPEFDEDDDEN
jgi:hypothetical protein